MSYINGVSTWVNSIFLNGGKTLIGEAGCRNVEIKGRYIIIQPDHKEFKEKIINNIYNAGKIRCISDYILVSEEVILVCEMKSNNEGQMKVQLKNTGRLVRYILEMTKEHHKIKSTIPPIKFVCFANLNKGFKQKTKGEKLDRFKWNNSELFQLACNSEYILTQFL